MTVAIEREMFGENEHLTLRVGKTGIRVSCDDLEEIGVAIQEFNFQESKERRDCPECFCTDQWESNDCVLEMRCIQCDHEERRQSGTYYNEEHEVI